ncbi:MAG: phytase, partial [Oceanobacter sp.]
MNAKWLPGARTTALVSTLTTLLMAAGCAHFSATGQSSPNQASKLPLTASTLGELKGEQVIQTTAGQWLAVSPDSGVQISDAQTAPNQLANIQSEYLDAKTSTKTGVKETHLLTLTTDNQLALLTLNSGSKLTTQALSSALPWSVEGLCLYQPVSSHALQAFVLDDNGMGHQMLLHSNGHQLNAREIRQLPLPPAAEYCTVDDQADRLYVSEEGIGLWVYNARAESELSRQVIDMVAPWGQMESTPGPMAIIDGELLMAEVSSNRIHRYQLTEDGAHRIGELTVAQAEMTSSESELAIESLFAGTGLEGQWLAFYDDESGELFTGSLNSVEILADQRAIDIIPEIPASAETTPVSTAGDAADDPAIWVNPNDASKSLILGTNKKRALVVYDLKGNKVQDLPVGRVNNVDVRQGFALKGQPMDIAAASHRDHASVMLFAIDPTTGQISEAGEVVTTLDDV